jgi:hypothetical protein
MKIELKPIIDQLSEAIELDDGYKVSALIDNREDIVGWTIVRVFEDGRFEPIDKDLQFNTIKDLIEAYL